MKKRLLLFLSLITLHGCVSETPQNEAQSTMANENQVKTIGDVEYEGIGNNLWLAKADYSKENQTLSVYDTQGHEKTFYNNLLNQLKAEQITPELSEKVVDKLLEKVISYRDTKVSIGYNYKSKALALINFTSQGDLADSISNMFSNLQRTNSIDSKSGSEVDRRSIEVVKNYMKLFDLPYEYDFVATSISTDKFKEIQNLAKKEYEPGDFPERVLNAQPFQFDVITLVPVLNKIPLIDGGTYIGATNHLNETIGTAVKFIVIDGKVAYVHIHHLFHPKKSQESVEYHPDKVLEAIRKRFAGLDIKEEIYIDAMTPKYLPIAKQDSGELYKDYQLQPLIEVLVHYGERVERFFISPLTYTEVK
ncbi:hypothetical protein IU403_02705 [Aerococcaceae bacterium zg-BR22]|uniref:hypothetical protein n=1 Tax=Aerococcaceae bacterium zg-1292 TaxID=2774330 RepID=UPI004063F6EA|nr:hypothetical protein [Aerococcaceae bacterium zg-BR22]